MRPAAALLILAAAALSACSSPPPRNVVVLCAGDSLTEHGYPRPLKRLLEKDGVRARVLNYGRSGHTSGEYLRFLRTAADGPSAERPDFILIQLGTNDVRVDGDKTAAGAFRENMRRVIELLSGIRDRRGAAPRIFLALVPPVPAGAGYPFSAESTFRVEGEINPILRRLADELGLVLVDNFTPFAGAPGLIAGVHPTEEGYRCMAASWLAALRPYLPR